MKVLVCLRDIQIKNRKLQSKNTADMDMKAQIDFLMEQSNANTKQFNAINDV